MKLPGGEVAFIDARKLTDYILSPTHPRGRHKARVFHAAWGLGPAEAALLIAALQAAAAKGDAVPGEADVHGQRFVIDFVMSYEGRAANIRSHWIVERIGAAPRFVTAFVKD